VTTVAFNSPVTYNGVKYPEWALVVGWFAALASMICIPIGIIYTLAKSRGTLYQVRILEISFCSASSVYKKVVPCR
jgi:solute carrier family 6 amino acid transporter-like protein 5/7/9/14